MSDKNKTGYLGTDDTNPMEPSNTSPLEDGILPWAIELRVVGTPDIIKANVKESILIGRSDPLTNHMPDIDLLKYGGQTKGVSRSHATLIVRDNRVTLIDLGSVNGTYINGRILVPNRPFRVRDRDNLRFGQLELTIRLVVRPHVSEETMVGSSNMLEIPHIGKGKRVLILDSDKYICSVIEHIIKQAKFTPIVAHSLPEAINAVDEQLPDAILLDPMLEVGDGLDLLMYIKKQHDKEVPAIVMSSATAGYQMEQSLDMGVDIFLSKPLIIDELVTALGKIVAYLDDPS